MHNWITVVYTWSEHNIVNLLYFNKNNIRIWSPRENLNEEKKIALEFILQSWYISYDINSIISDTVCVYRTEN